MANPNGAKGARWENAIVQYLRDNGRTAERLPRTGQKDQGDGYELMKGTSFYTMWEAKAEKRIDLPRYLRELEEEKENFRLARGLETFQCAGVVIVKRRNHGVGKAYAVQTLDAFFGIGER